MWRRARAGKRAVRLRALRLAQTSEARGAIAAELDTVMAPYQVDDHCVIEGELPLRQPTSNREHTDCRVPCGCGAAPAD